MVQWFAHPPVKLQRSSVASSGPQQGDVRFSDIPSAQGAGDGARTRDRMVPADLRADTLTIVPPTPRTSGRTCKRFHGLVHRRF
ncbi:hypothetical protein PoB_006732300 [Plakobranchus ocellatus]|uniref:Uncharacterized protein n=1 Tax=Plakobranchus ocellatus TaxID=259542 RepID=A0AAV4D9G4_9GAST|nr:hypothetical protein PoB_006732300 [Plakobranchus ocellatus]